MYKMPFLISTVSRLNQILKDFDINQLAFYSVVKLSKLFAHVKDKTPVYYVLYTTSCNDCEEVYVGQTGRQLYSRILSIEGM